MKRRLNADASDDYALLSAALADTISDLRGEADISQERLSFMADLNRTYVGKIERVAANPTVQTLAQLFRALNLDPESGLALYLKNVKKRRRQGGRSPSAV